MPNQKKKAESKKDRHKPARTIRIHPKLAEALDVIAERNATSAPIEANRAVREMAQREGVWPTGR